MAVRILIVDDFAAVRRGIRSLLRGRSFRVCGEAAGGWEAIKKTAELRPDIILMDISVPGMSGVRAAYEIRRVAPATKIVFLTVHNLPAVALSTQRWADGFVSKGVAGTQLIPLLRRLTEKRPQLQYKNDFYDCPEGQFSKSSSADNRSLAFGLVRLSGLRRGRRTVTKSFKRSWS